MELNLQEKYNPESLSVSVVIEFGNYNIFNYTYYACEFDNTTHS